MSIKKIVLSVLFCFILCISQFPTVVHASTYMPSYMDLLLPQTMELAIGEEVSLLSRPYIYGAFTFKSSKTSVASVDDFGMITAKKEGTTTITVTFSSSSIKFKVVVVKTTLTLNKASLILEPSKEYQLLASTSNDSCVTYKSSKKSIATIDENGMITAIKPGETIITATANSTKATCKVVVKPPTLQLNQSSITLFRNGTYLLKATVSNQAIPTYKSSHKSVATIDAQGRITAIKHGTSTITATVNGSKATCIVTVKQPTITLSNTELSLIVGQQHTLNANVSSGNQPSFQSSNRSIVTVDSNGLLTPKKQGSAYITVSEDGVKTKCKVTVSTATLQK